MDWRPFSPPGEEQISDPIITKMYADSLGCVSFSAVHCIESQEIKKFGHTLEYSERALAKLSGTTTQGNSFENVVNAIKKYGLILEKDWPTPKSFTWAEFYADIPQEIINKAVPVEVDFLTTGASLENAPLWTEIGKNGQMAHVVEQLNSNQYFDSYKHTVDSFIGNLNIPIINQYQIILKGYKMLPIYKSVVKADGKTFGVLIQTPNGDQIIYATTPEQWMSWSKTDSYALDTINADGTPKWQAEITLPF